MPAEQIIEIQLFIYEAKLEISQIIIKIPYLGKS